MARVISNLNIVDRNTDIPFFPSITWNFTNSDIISSLDQLNGPSSLYTFSWIQAFFNPIELTGLPQLAIWAGGYQSDGVTPLLNGITFAYSGERINIKGQVLFTTGLNQRGQTVSSTPIGSTQATDPATDLLLVTAYGGMS